MKLKRKVNNIAILISPYCEKIQMELNQQMEEQVKLKAISQFRFLTEPKDVLSQLNTLQKEFDLKIKSQKYETAVSLRKEIDLLINQILEVENYNDILLTKEFIDGNLMYIFKDK